MSPMQSRTDPCGCRVTVATLAAPRKRDGELAALRLASVKEYLDTEHTRQVFVDP